MSSHTHIPPVNDARYREVRNVTLVGSVVDLLLGIAKIIVGFTAHSQSLIADGFHSLSDLGTDLMVLFAARHSHRAADAEHPYGHGRIETVATVLLGIALFAVAAGISFDAVRRLFQPELLLQPEPMAIVIAIISVFAKEAIYQYTVRAARRLRSNMLHANAWHSRSDAISSIIVVIGVTGTMYGLPYLDAIAAVGVSLMIIKIGGDLMWSSMQELIDTALDAGEVSAIRDAIMEVNGVQALHMLRTRRSGSDALVDVHLLVDGALSVSEGHQIGESVRGRLMNDFDEITDVTVHIDPEDDERNSPCHDLPMREDMLLRLKEQWKGLDTGDAIEKVIIHYLGGKVHLELVLSRKAIPEATRQGITESLIEAAKRLDEVGDVKVYIHW